MNPDLKEGHHGSKESRPQWGAGEVEILVKVTDARAPKGWGNLPPDRPAHLTSSVGKHSYHVDERQKDLFALFEGILLYKAYN